MSGFVNINEETCIGCGLCSEVCSAKILKLNNKKIKVVDYPNWGCHQCGLCMSVCPTKSIKVKGFDYDDFELLSKNDIDFSYLENMLTSRRSIRKFKDRKVERKVLDAVIRISALAPIGAPPSDVQVLVLDRTDDLKELMESTSNNWKKMIKSMKNPIYRFISKRVAGAKMYHALTSHALPAANIYCESADNGVDVFTFNAPAILLFHGNKLGVCVTENCWLASTYAVIAAHSFGLGSIFSGMIPPIMNMNADVKRKLGIPKENNVYCCLMLGYPNAKFKRKIPRSHKEVRYIGEK